MKGGDRKGRREMPYHLLSHKVTTNLAMFQCSIFVLCFASDFRVTDDI